MSGEVQLKTVADYQAAIQKLDRNKPADREKIMEYQNKIGEILSGASKDKPINTGSNDIFVRTTEDSVKVTAHSQLPDQEDIEYMGDLKDKEKVKDKFGKDKDGKMVSKEDVKLDKKAYKAARKEVKNLEKQLKELSKNPTDPNYNAKMTELNAKLAEAQERVGRLQEDYLKNQAAQKAQGGRTNRNIRKAAEHNEKHYKDVQNREQVYLTKEQEKAAIKENPNLKGHTKVLNEGNIQTLGAMYRLAEREIAEAEKSDSPQKIAAAKERYGEWLDIFGKDEKGNVDFSSVNTKAAQKALLSMTGDDANGNLDEVNVASKQLGVSKGQFKSTLKAFGFGTEGTLGKRLKNAGIAAAAVALTGLAFKNHSHKTAEASASAKGETVTGEVKWIASNGEKFYKYFEAQGGEAAVNVVAEACAKLPWIGRLAAPVAAGVTAFFLTKGSTEDAFDGAKVEAALKNLNNVKGNDNKAIVSKIQDITITDNKGVDDAIKAAIINSSIGEDTTKANTEELLAALKHIEDAKNTIGKIEAMPTEEEPPKPPVEEKKPNLDIEDEEKHEKVRVRTELPRLKYREGTYYTSHGYVGDDGKNLTPAERKQVQAELRKAENMIAYVDTNGDGKANARDKKVSLPTEITLPSGKKVKLADDAYERIMKLPASGGGKNGKYGKNVVVVMDKTTHKYYVIDKDNGNKRIAGPYGDKQSAINKKTELETPKEEKK